MLPRITERSLSTRVAAVLLLTWLPAQSAADPPEFDHRVDRFEVQGNLPVSFVDEFDDGVLDWTVDAGTVVEAGGFLELTSPGSQHDLRPFRNAVGYQSVAASAGLVEVETGQGDFSASSVWVSSAPHFPAEPDGRLCMALVAPLVDMDGLPLELPGRPEPAPGAFHVERWNLCLTNLADDRVAFRRGRRLAGPALFFVRTLTTCCDAPGIEFGMQVLGNTAIELGDVTGDIVLRLSYTDADDRLDASYSLDGGATFEAPFAPATVRLTRAGSFDLMGEPLLAANPASQAEQDCINAAGKAARRVADAQAKEVSLCVNDGAKGKLSTTIEECTTSDRKGRVAKQEEKLDDDLERRCGEGSAFIALADAAGLKDAAKRTGLGVGRIFGEDLDAGVIPRSTSVVDSRCQFNVVKAVEKCQEAIWKEYNACQKDSLQGKKIRQAATSADVVEACLGFDTDPFPDPKERIFDKCHLDLESVIRRKCPDRDSFPGCPGAVFVRDVQSCIEPMIHCAVCNGINAVNGFSRDCDAMDDGLANGSCEPPL